MSYKKILITEYGEPEVLQLKEEEKLPQPGNGEIRVKVLKTSANFTDTMIRKGMYPDVKEKPPFAPGYDMIGTVDKAGEGATKFKEGQRVADMTVIGAYSEYICLPQDQLVAVPDELDSSEAVSLILSYMTAYQMMFRVAKLQKEATILIHGAGGAVGLAILQLGKTLGLKMYGTASKAKHELVKKNGGLPIDYRNEDFQEVILRKHPEGIDAAFDPIGGDNFKKSFHTLKSGGTLVAFGFYNAVMGKGGNIPLEFMKVAFWNLLPNGKRSKFYSIGSFRKKHPDWFKEDLSILFELLKDGLIHPEIEAHYPLEKAVEVHKLIEEAAIKGKVIFNVGE